MERPTEYFPNDRPRSEDSVMFLGKPAAHPRTPAPNAVDLLAQLIEQQAASERAAAQRHAEVLQRLDAIDKAVAAADDSAGCAASAVDDLKRYAGDFFAVTVDAIHDVHDLLDPPQAE
jgi:hypothetical protein